jgi:hypothetical protein
VHYVVDGGSTDGTQEIVRESISDSRRTLIEGKDKGLYDAIFKGFERAQLDGYDDPSTICLWLNADDLLMPWAFATLRQAFARTGAHWITALPSLWDSEGRLVLVSPYNWHVRSFIRMGLYYGQGLGWIQQESTFFTKKLLDQIPDQTLAAIRNTRLAGDFLLWRAFADHAAPIPLCTTVSGFRSHGANASTLSIKGYYAELRSAGIVVLPAWLGRLLRLLLRPIALLQVARSVRKQTHSLRTEEITRHISG